MESITVPSREWNELKSLMLEIREKVSMLVSESENELLTPSEVCTILKISRNTYQRYVEAGIFEQIRIDKNKKSRVFIKRSDINKRIEEGRV